MDLNKSFIDKGVYKLISLPNSIFLCESLQGSQIGKLIMYKKIIKGIYEKSNISYFLNNYQEGDLKELFVNRSCYDMIGRLDLNYKQVDEYIIKKEI